MRLFTAEFVQRWHGRMLNIHPSLLPSFPGLDPQAQALRAGVKISGATVHFVIPETDAGPIVMQGAVAVCDGDTPETLAARILAIEHRIYPEALRLVASGRIRLEGDICKTAGGVGSGAVLISPAVTPRPCIAGEERQRRLRIEPGSEMPGCAHTRLADEIAAETKIPRRGPGVHQDACADRDEVRRP